MMEAIISALTFLTVVLLVLGLHYLTIRNRERIKERINSLSKNNSEDLAETGEHRKKIDFKSLLSWVGKIFAARLYTHKMEVELSKAGILLRGEEFIGLNILTSAVGGIVGFLFFGGVVPAMLLTFIGILIPGFMVRYKKRARVNELNQQIGDCLTVMTNSLRAGYSFQQAMDLVGKEMTGPLAVEFRRTLREINLGNTTEQALQNLTQRVESDDLELMITAVLIQRQIGGNLAEIFDKISTTIRERIRMKGEIKTLTAQGRISGVVIGLIPVGLFIILILVSPSYINLLLERRAGWIILGVSIVSELIGFIMIRKIVTIEF
jgi:tight adherence protein B